MVRLPTRLPVGPRPVTTAPPSGHALSTRGLMGQPAVPALPAAPVKSPQEIEYERRQAEQDTINLANSRLTLGGTKIGYGNAQIGTLSAEQGYMGSQASTGGEQMSLENSRLSMLRDGIQQGLQLKMEQQRQDRTVNQHGYGAFARIVGY